MILARPIAAAAVLGCLALTGIGASDANAQQIYRIVGPDGRVTFSDKPPADGSGSKGSTLSLSAATDAASFPFELRQAATRYPVTLYTAPGCGPCTTGRGMLMARGIPFSEKSVTSNEDIEALKRLAGASSVPFLTIGGQQLRGYSEVEWTQFLDAAGYPKTSQLPAGYARAPVTPLVAVQEQQAARPAPPPPPAPATAAGPAAEPGPTPDNPKGIRF
ncbi:glutaredoxin domain-containing protein [Caenimonas aquaedulcis]|uniref:Glutaredoxin family protein n=1 Tax=Caenimonas aquaedulcis TaxID=2793270 RepID=A0A931H1C8_9BURK|nr:glutaredoxin domain-containing protein [Caenimonas aquaedulcis]MBG9386784.1 glutaredoxin family protein [Caenimonas aquaedulcis]